MHIKYRPDIDGLRAVAVGAVLLFHAGFTAFSGGFVGVDVFFVISGYLIGRALFADADAGRLSIARFYERRFRRILPALLVVMLATLVVGTFVLLPSELIGLGKSIVASALFGANFYFHATQNYFGGVPLSKPLLHMWSLAVEEQYYLVWPIVVLLLYRFGLKRWRTPLIVVAITLSLAAAEVMLSYSPKTTFYMLPMRAWELLAGALIATGDLPAVRRRASAEALSAVGLALILAPIFLYTETIRFPGLSAVPPVLGTALLIHIGQSVPSRTHRLLSLPPVLFVGLISYSLYLWHWPIFSLHFLATQRDATTSESIAMLALSVLLAWLSWRFIERPFRRPAADGAPRRTTIVLVASGAALLVTAGAGLAVNALRGLPQRLPPAARIVDAQHSEKPTIQLGCLFQGEVRGDAVTRCFDRVRRDPHDKIVLWGDSFARQHIDVLSARIRAAGLVPVSFIATGCLPTPGVDATFGQGRVDTRCADFSNRVATELARMPGLRGLIVAGRWSNLAGIRFPGDVRDPTARFLLVHGSDTRSLDATVRALSSSLGGIAADMDRRGVPTVFVTEPPRYARAARPCVARALWHDRSAAACGSDAAEQRAFRAPVAHIFNAALATSPRATVYDPLPRLCTPSCTPFAAGRLLTYDYDHLTRVGSAVALRGFVLPVSPPRARRQNPAGTAARPGTRTAGTPADRSAPHPGTPPPDRR
ncbi:acyltransferase family protein [Sphingomonas prati]|uniref:Peptidoglycan/LPS O-acetylase OafA/YrhL n=1 Tax=Sphingomonas prati TaxID=1843237 RepID=A0A7W9BSE5_9SPHN|nr:acyltransferase family protein [Sphingomonas prati]MBB5729222.1 peptidoglycan/LPS O-acetylase OafA/YrhL [Sphingomonas prati]